jgi:hypothetical protein
MRNGVVLKIGDRPKHKTTADRLFDAADPVQVDEFYKDFRPSIPLDRALLCLECSNVYEVGGGLSCPSCNSRQSWPIASWIDRGADYGIAR